MENLNNIVAPYLNAEVYRTNTSGNSNVSYLDYIRIHKDGNVLIGSSELTGRYWDGGASILNNLAEAKSSPEQDKRCISLTCGTADGCFIESYQKVLLCEDSGAVSIWTTPDEHQAWQIWREEKSVAEHDFAALAVDCLDPGKEYVTVGADGNAKVWDISEMICLRHYKAHTMPAVGVSVRTSSNSDFATCSYDEHLSLWDKNINKPAMDLFKNDCGISCMQWLDEDRLVFGDEVGILRLLDIRNNEIMKLTQFPAAVCKLAYNADVAKVAVICDDSIVSVCEIKEDSSCEVVYHDRHMHSGLVTGLAWDHAERNLLHTLGWDSLVKSHTIL